MPRLAEILKGWCRCVLCCWILYLFCIYPKNKVGEGFTELVRISPGEEGVGGSEPRAVLRTLLSGYEPHYAVDAYSEKQIVRLCATVTI